MDDLPRSPVDGLEGRSQCLMPSDNLTQAARQRLDIERTGPAEVRLEVRRRLGG